MATALFVLGPERGLALAERERLAAYFIVRERDGAFSERRVDAHSRRSARQRREDDAMDLPAVALVIRRDARRVRASAWSR